MNSGFVDARPEYAVTDLGSQAIVSGRKRAKGSVLKINADNAAYYLEMGWVEPIKPKRSTSRNAAKVHND